MSKQPKHLARKTIYQSPWVNLHLDRVKLPSGKIIEEYHTVEHVKGGVSALITNAKGEILMIQNLRYRQEKPSWEIPAGSIEEGETAIEAAKREVLEETGYTAINLRQLHSYLPSNGISTEVLDVVFGEVKDANQVEFDTDEVESVHWLNKDEVKRMIYSGEINDGCSLVPLLLYLNQ